MTFSNTLSELPGQVLVDGLPLTQINSTKFLGLFIDCKLTWNTQIDHLCKLLSWNVGVINKLKSYVLKILYSTLLLPYLN